MMFTNRKLFSIICFILAGLIIFSGSLLARDKVVFTYQTWTEQYILGDITRMVIEEYTDVPLEIAEIESHNLQMRAFEEGQVDIVTMYTSSAYMEYLGDTGLRDSEEIFNYVNQKFEEELNAKWVVRYGFYNNYDLAVTPEIKEKYDLKTYSDLAEVADELTIAADVNFPDREDTYPLLQNVYGMEFKDVQNVGVQMKYRLIEAGEAEVVNCYTTDSQVKKLNLEVLEDDKSAFPPYDAGVFVRIEVLNEYPELGQALKKLEGLINNDEMREMNYKVSVEREDSKKVAEEFLKEKGLLEENE